MVHRTPSKILELACGGKLYASGQFTNMAGWCGAGGIVMVVCLLSAHQADWHLGQTVQEYTQMDFNNNAQLEEKLLGVLKALTSTLYSGKHALVHCQHGVHRTGAIIVLQIALMLLMTDMAEQSGQSALSSRSWPSRVDEAFNIWSEERQLNQASVECTTINRNGGADGTGGCYNYYDYFVYSYSDNKIAAT